MNIFKIDGKINKRQIAQVALLLAALAFLGGAPQYESNFVLTGSAVVMYIILALSWTIFSAPTGYVSLATAAFFGLGIYFAAVYSEKLPLPVLMLAGGGVAFVVAIIMGAITLRLRGVYFTIFTFGLVEFLKSFVLWVELETTGKRGRFVSSSSNVTVYYYLFGLLVLVIVAAFIIKRSRFGKALVSIGESEDAAAHIGINTTLVKLISFAIGSFFMGAVGAAMATRWTYIDPGIAFNSLYSFLPVLMVIFGGMDNLAGPIIGAAVFAYLQELFLVKFSSYYMIGIGLVMIVAILFLPRGLVGLCADIMHKISGRNKTSQAQTITAEDINEGGGQ